MSGTIYGMARTAACLGVAAVMLAGCGGNRSFSLGNDGLGLGSSPADPDGGTGDGTGGGGTDGGGTGGGGSDGGAGGGSGGGGTGGGPGGGSGGGTGGGSGGGTGGGGSGGTGSSLNNAGLTDVLDSLGRVTVGDKTVLGSGSGPQTIPPLGVSIGSPTQAAGQVATVGVLSGGQVLNANIGQGNASSTPTGGTPTSLLGLTVAGNPVLGSGSGDPAIDIGVLSPGAAQGTAGSVNLLSNGQPVGVNLGSGGATGLLGGALTPVTSGPLAPVVTPVVGTVTGAVAGLTSGGGSTPTPTNPVTGVVAGLPVVGPTVAPVVTTVTAPLTPVVAPITPVVTSVVAPVSGPVGGLTGTLTGGVAGGVGAGVGVGAGPGGAAVGGGIVGGLTGGLTGGLLGRPGGN